jgi:hypothetical protein
MATHARAFELSNTIKETRSRPLIWTGYDLDLDNIS